MNIIAIDTSTESLGLCLKTETMLLRISQKANFKHAEALAPWIEKLCIEASIKPGEINLVIVSIGPGSFTGLRIGLATAKGLAMGAACPITGVPTLDAIAWSHKHFGGSVIPIINAKKNRLYAALYQNNKRVSDYLDISTEELFEKLRNLNDILITGPYGEEFYKTIHKRLKNTNIFVDPDFSLINSYSLLQKGAILYTEGGIKSMDIFPLYLRKSEAELSLNKGNT